MSLMNPDNVNMWSMTSHSIVIMFIKPVGEIYGQTVYMLDTKKYDKCKTYKDFYDLYQNNITYDELIKRAKKRQLNRPARRL